MRKIYLFVAILCASLFIACNFTEEIFIEEDGSGKISIKFDGSELMEMAGEQFSEGKEKPIDSIISFKDILIEKKDSIALLSEEDQMKFKKLEPFKMHMLMDPVGKEMKFDMFSEFDDINEVGDIFNTFQNASAFNPGGKGSNAQGPFSSGGGDSEVNYTFKGNKFSRKSKILDQELHQQKLDSMASMEMFFSASKYTLKYHFPRRVKSASAEEATYSADGKTLIYELGFMDYLKNPDAFDLEVELED